MTSFPPPWLCEAGSWGGADTYVGSERGIEMCELEVGSLGTQGGIGGGSTT